MMVHFIIQIIYLVLVNKFCTLYVIGPSHTRITRILLTNFSEKVNYVFANLIKLKQIDKCFHIFYRTYTGCSNFCN